MGKIVEKSDEEVSKDPAPTLGEPLKEPETTSVEHPPSEDDLDDGDPNDDEDEDDD